MNDGSGPRIRSDNECFFHGDTVTEHAEHMVEIKRDLHLVTKYLREYSKEPYDGPTASRESEVRCLRTRDNAVVVCSMASKCRPLQQAFHPPPPRPAVPYQILPKQG